MHIHHTIESIRTIRAATGTIAFVPTMGNLHEGHIALMHEARLHADTVIASIFVNRLQFGPAEDFDRYPRTFENDCAKLKEAGVDHLFAPDETVMYPQPQLYHVTPATSHTSILEGAIRPGHFTGVATVVLKLFNIVQPDIALFGKKDYQQLMVLRNMIQELALPITVIAGNTIRAEDGLALSSRNGYLTTEQRQEAPRLYKVLNRIAEAVRAGEQDLSRLEQAASDTLNTHGWQTDYIAIRRRSDLQPPESVPPAPSDSLIVLGAARLGTTRLIDNLEI